MAGTLQLMGADLGKDLMEGKQDNQKGFFENNEVVKINDDLLAFHQSEWDSIFPLPRDWENDQALRPFAKRIQQLLYNGFEISPFIAIKDPRLGFTLPFWQKNLTELGIEHKYIIMLRHPAEVSQSLKKRNYISTEKAHLLWTQTMLSIEKNTRKHPRVFVHFQDLIDFPELQLQNISQTLSFSYPKDIQRELPHIQSFLTPSLKHHSIPVHEKINVGPALLEQVKKTLWAIAEKPADENLFLQLDHFQHTWSKALHFFHPIELAESIQESNKKTEEIHGFTQQIHHITQEKNSLETHLNSLLLSEANREKEIASLKQDKEHQFAEIDALLHLKAQIQAQLDWQLQEKTYQTLEINNYQTQRIKLEAENQALRNSLSFRLGWGLTAPVRWLYEGLFKSDKTVLGLGVKMFFVAFRKPQTIGKHLTLTNLKTLGRALKAEKPSDIFNNFNQLVGINPKPSLFPSPSPSSPIEVPEEAKEAFTQEKYQELQTFLEQGKPLVYPNSESPEISIILILYNRAELTLACLRSLQQLSISTEIVLIDNASSDQTEDLLAQLQGVNIIRNTENKGFLLACNEGSAQANGRHLLFLNNDAQLKQGSLEAALNTLESSSDIGAVGGKIILLDGKLQEAGNIIWQDGSCLGYGRNQDPNSPAYMFRRDVDYVSGVFLLTPKSLFEKLGGFDPLFVPAYYEETDYCLSLWQAGYRVVYEPQAEVIHFEFGSSDQVENAIAMQQAHQLLFSNKHQETLLNHKVADAQHILQARSAAAVHKKRILYVEDKIPHIDAGSGFPRSNQIVNHFHQLGYFVSVLSSNFPNEDTWEVAYRDLPEEVEILIGYRKEDLETLLQTRTDYYDIIWISRPHNMTYFLTIRSRVLPYLGHAKLVYDAEAIFSNREMTWAHLQNDKKAIQKTETQLAEELMIGKQADAIIAVNATEANQFKAVVNAPVFVLDAAFNQDPITTPFVERSGLLFVGNMDHDASPNVDGIEWIVKEVYPHLKDRIGTPDLVLVGSNKSPKVSALAKKYPFIKLLGQVKDLKVFFEKSKLFVAPTRYAAGSPAKVLQAAAFGLPIVCTDLLTGQLGWQDGKTVLSASRLSPKQFADQICDLYPNEELSKQLVQEAFKALKAHCSPRAQRETLEKILEGHVYNE